MSNKIPTKVNFMQAILRWASYHSEDFHVDELDRAMVEEFQLTEEQQIETTPKTRQVKYKTRMRIALHDLKTICLIQHSEKQDHYEITSVGRQAVEFLNRHRNNRPRPERLMTGYL